MKLWEIIKQILAMSEEDREYTLHAVLSSWFDYAPPLSAEDREEMLRQIAFYQKSSESLLTWEQVKMQLAEQRRRQIT